MEKRARSPNYPALSLPEAIERVGMVYRNQHKHAAPREVVVKSMGYAGINGASATAFSALLKYGLLERNGEDNRVSERAMRILHPNSAEEKGDAIRAAASEPALFAELNERFPGPLPAEDVLRNYLIRKGFVPAALSNVILAYRETMELVDREGGAYDSNSPSSPTQGAAPMQQVQAPPPAPSQHTVYKQVMSDDERSLGRHDFDDGTYVRISASASIDTEEALDWIAYLIEGKRRELQMRNARRKADNSPPPEVGANEFEDDDDA